LQGALLAKKTAGSSALQGAVRLGAIFEVFFYIKADSKWLLNA
jgi:hypothetical protein